jgi:DNA replication protein DnaC
VLVVDDWAMAPLTEPERRDFWEICEERYQTRSVILTSQIPVARWHEQVGDATVADGILDRLVHNAHRIEMRGDGWRTHVSVRRGCVNSPRLPHFATKNSLAVGPLKS